MRYTPALKLSTRLTAFFTIIVIGAMFILFVGGTLSFQNIGKEYLHQQLEGIIFSLDKEVISTGTIADIQLWMPRLLEASNIVEMKLSTQQGEVFYQYQSSVNQIDTSRLYEMSYLLEKNPDYIVDIKVLPPYLEQSHSLSALSFIALAIALVLLCLLQGVNWLKKQLKGSELLEERGRMILAGRVEQYSRGNPMEWPYTASEALDSLIEELNDARKERSRFDSFIRSHIFLDQLTGAANRVLFDSKLESILQESGATGGVLLFRIYEWEQLTEGTDKKKCDEFIVEVGRVISNIVQRFPNVLFARYYDSEYAILIPHQSSKDISTVVSQCVKQLDKIVPLSQMEPDNWYHIGMTMYSEGERRGHILNEAETALKSAQLQNSNNWSRFSKKTTSNDTRGTVRWRTLFDQSLSNKKVLIFEQPCYLIDRSDINDGIKLLHHELFVRIDDGGVGILKASRFMSAVEQVGYQLRIDRWVVSTIFKQLKATSSEACYSINLHVQPFCERAHLNWLRDEILQFSAEKRSKLSFEFVEGQLVKHLDYMRPVVRMISGLGCEIIVGQAGRTIISTHYIKDMSINYLKLHRSLVKRVEQRQENQLFIRSLIGACEGTNTQVIAVGVGRDKEWSTLLNLGVHGGQGRIFQAEKQLIPRPEIARLQIGRRNRWRKKG